MYYENWVKSSMSDNCLKFQELWELIMVQFTSEVKCEIVGKYYRILAKIDIENLNVSINNCFQ